ITADFDCSRSGSFRTVLAVRLCLLFAMERGLQLPWQKHYSTLDIVTSSAFPSTDLVKLLRNRLRENYSGIHFSERRVIRPSDVDADPKPLATSRVLSSSVGQRRSRRAS